jgi:hypothetical protein
MLSAAPARGNNEGIFMMGMGSRTARDGTFTMSGVPPGDYNLQVRSLTVMTSGMGGGDTMMFVTRTAGPGGGNESEFASQPLSVAGEDVSNVVITTTKGATAAGRVVFEGDTRPPGAGGLRVTSIPTDTDAQTAGGLGSAVKEDGSFELKGLTGGRVLRVIGLPNGWTLKAVESNGIDVTDTGMEFKGADTVGGIDIVVSPKSTDVNGSVTLADGSAAKDYTVVIFADDQLKWSVPSTRWVSGVRPDQDGRYHVRNLPAGSYYAVAVDYLPQGEWFDPELLDRLKLKADRFSLGEGESKALDLKVSGGAQ